MISWIDTSQDFNDGLHRMQRLLNIPSKQDDNTSVLQAMSKLIADKLNPDAVKQAIEEAKKPKKEVLVDEFRYTH